MKRNYFVFFAITFFLTSCNNISNETKSSYTVKWINEDGTILEIDEKVEKGVTPEYNGKIPTKPEDEYSYTFKGWDKEIVPCYEDTIYTAIFDKEEIFYTVTWLNEDDSILEVDEKVKKGTTPEYNGETPTKAEDDYSYTFKGWDKEITPCYKNTTYKAVFDKEEIFYKVTWKNYDGTVLEIDEKVKKGTLPKYNGDTPTKPEDEYSYTFVGWDKEIVPCHKDTIYTAIFDKEEIFYRVTWLNEDETILEVDEKVKKGATPKYNGETPTKAEDDEYFYTFNGWNKEIEQCYEDTIYIATYKKEEIFYKVTWKNYDGTVLEIDEKVKKGTLPKYSGETPSKNGNEQHFYEFIGWDKDIEEVTCDVTYVATFKECNYFNTVKYLNYDGTVLKTIDNVAYNEFGLYSGDIPVKESKDKYRFIGWSPKIERIKEDTTYIAQFEEINETNKEELTRIPTKKSGQVFIYGEHHGDQGVLEEELKIWDNYYNNYGFRHLIVEWSAYHAEMLNTYINSKDDEIWNNLYKNLVKQGANASSIHVYNFYKTIKYKYPETILHGIDVTSVNTNPEGVANEALYYGWICESQYDKVLESLKQSEIYYLKEDLYKKREYRELTLGRNFMKVLTSLKGENVMDICGNAHSVRNGYRVDLLNVPIMSNIVYRSIGENLYEEDLASFANHDKTMPDDEFLDNLN